MQIGEGELSLLLATWPAMGERERDALNEEVGGSWWNLVENGILEKWKSCGLWRKERKIRKRKKEKKLKREDIFSWI